MLILFLFVASPLAVLCVPRRWLGFTMAIVLLFGGCLWLDSHTVSTSDQGMFGSGKELTVFWTGVALAPGVFRLIYGYGKGASEPNRILTSWVVPAIILAAVLFMHWLRNRLAGAQPAWLIHLPFFASLAIGAALVWKCRAERRIGQRIGLVGGLILASIGVLAVGDSAIALQTMAEASDEADGSPYCLLSFAGTEHPRAASGFFELSPLVSRYRGRTYRHGSHFLIVGGQEGSVTPMRIVDRWGNAHFSGSPLPPDQSLGEDDRELPPCRPVPGGGIRGL